INKESKYYGLIIGIDDYLDENINDLENPIEDGELLKNVLISKYTFEEENISLLKNPTYAEMCNAFQELSKRISKNDNLLIFYAGHGVWDEKSSLGYWLPSDARKDNNAFWFRNSVLVDYLKQVQSNHTLLIADACFSGSIFKSRSAFDNSSRSYDHLYSMPSRKAMTSGSLKEVPDRSAFIKYLINVLSENDQQYLGSMELFNNIRMAVMNNSENIPQYGDIKNVGDEGGEFLFIRK
ncbi:MAG: caspase family protein, partial [Bacteroidales bacterium]|nr:caspase family protein [Bacteroidales bacterium]